MGEDVEAIGGSVGCEESGKLSFRQTPNPPPSIMIDVSLGRHCPLVRSVNLIAVAPFRSGHHQI